MSETLQAEKIALRRHAREENASRSAREKAAASSVLCGHIRMSPHWTQSRAILAYSALPDEPDLAELWTDSLLAGKLLAWPRFDPVRGQYGAAAISDPPAQLSVGRYGVREPPADAEPLELNRLDLVLAPGVAFSLAGARLGRGKGYYDRLLAEVSGLKCGVAFDWQLKPSIPVEPHDVRLDCVVTPAGWHHLAHRQSDGLR